MNRSRIGLVCSGLLLAVILLAMLVSTSFAGDIPEKPAAKSFPVKTKTAEPKIVACLAYKGSYDAHERVIGKLTDWVKQNGLLVAGPVCGVYYNNPMDSKPEELKWEIQIPVVEGVTASAKEGEPTTKERGAALVAYTFYKGPYEQVGMAYGALFEWVGKNGYVPAGPCTEIFWSDPSTPKESCVTEIQVPINPVKK
ncbi:MAG: GyrI-like domain-containing protein [Candidatus Eisenbacteria bacterium]|nr:GyrI-like domain-containing protein [Candidatus Eisenbacteria bacterium]